MNAEQGKWAEAIEAFLTMPEPGSRIYFNIASMYLRLGDLAAAEESLDTCVEKDPHLALGYFQRGCLHLQNKRYEKAKDDFSTAMKNLRGNLLIDYKQLGLTYKLYSCEVNYNQAYTLYQMGRREEALKELQVGEASAVDCSESRHKIITAAIDKLRSGDSFLPYRLPKSSMLFVPPRTKTDMLNPMQFMGKAKVVSSIVDADDYTGFVGAQGRERTPSPSPAAMRKSPPQAPVHTNSSPILSTGPRAQKPSIPPPQPNPDTSRRVSAPVLPTNRLSSRPPKPTNLPPSPARSPDIRKLSTPTNGFSPSPSPTKSPEQRTLSPPTNSPNRSSSPLPGSNGAITVKVHYSTTRAVRVAATITYKKLLGIISKKFEKEEDSITLWYKGNDTEELLEMQGDQDLREACRNLEEGFRLTLWAYDSEESEPVMKEVMAISEYSAQYDDELTFRKGDRLQVYKEVNEDWYHGRFHEDVGIFPKSYVTDI